MTAAVLAPPALRERLTEVELASLFVQLLFGELARRFPEAELAETESKRTGGAMLRRLARLPLRLGTERA